MNYSDRFTNLNSHESANCLNHEGAIFEKLLAFHPTQLPSNVGSTKLASVPESEAILELFQDLVGDPKTGKLISAQRFQWGAFTEPNLSGAENGFVVDAFYSVADERYFSLLAYAVEEGNPGGYTWSFEFTLKGELYNIEKIIDTQNLTLDPENFEMDGEEYYPGGSERQKNEGLQTLQTLVEILKTSKIPLTAKDPSANLFL